MHLLSPPELPRLFWIPALVAGAIALGFVAVVRAERGSSDYPPTVEFGQSLLLEGENTYATRDVGATHNKYPPSFFVLTAPFTLLPYSVGAALFYAVSVLLALAAAWLAVAAVRPPGAAPPTAGTVAVPALLVTPLIVPNLLLGQVNLIVLGFVAAGLYLATRRRDLAAGVSVLVATALKLTPALLVAGFAWKGGWRVLVGAAIGLVLCFAVLPAAVWGPSGAAERTRDWTHVVRSFADEGAAAEVMDGQVIGFRQTNQSLDATLRRHLADVPAVQPRGGRPAFHTNVADLAPDAGVLDVLSKGITVLLLLALLWVARGPLATTGRLALGLDVSLALIVILLISPISWNHYYVALLVPFATALEAARRRPVGDRLRTWLLRAVVAAFALIVIGLCPYGRAFSVLLLAAVVLGVALTAARINERSAT